MDEKEKRPLEPVEEYEDEGIDFRDCPTFRSMVTKAFWLAVAGGSAGVLLAVAAAPHATAGRIRSASWPRAQRQMEIEKAIAEAEGGDVLDEPER